MPLVPFESLPDDARVWVFASDRPLAADSAARLLAETDRYLSGWKAHGEPLTCGRTLTESRFLTIAVDQRDAHASGCSVDGLHRTLKQVEREIGASLVGASRVHFRTPEGAVQSVERGEFAALAAEGLVRGDTRAFDPTVQTLGEWRARFETRVRDSWHARLL